jgi:hypothetical protein
MINDEGMFKSRMIEVTTERTYIICVSSLIRHSALGIRHLAASQD